MAFKGTARFRLVRRLGGGSFGSVYEAEDLQTNRAVALKVLDRTDPDSLVRFKAEFRSLAGFRHRNVVALYELLSDGDHWFYTLELIRGSELLEYLARQEIVRALENNAVISEASRSLTEAYVRDVRVALMQLVEAIAAVHAFGRLHRDIKPTNILVTDDGRVVLLDFGLVREIRRREMDETTSIAGTPGYIAPEQIEGGRASEASDWYSLGVVLYQALTGALPFSGSFFEIAVAQRTTDAPPPSSLVGGIPPELDELCSALLQRDPAKRPSLQMIRTLLSPGEIRYWLPPFRARRLGHDRSFVGRRSYMEQLFAAHEQCKRGEGRAIFLHGSSGVGKTSLVNEFLDQVRATSDVFILAGRCYERELLPYRAIDGVIDSLARLFTNIAFPAEDGFTASDIAVACTTFPILRQIERFRRRITESQTLPTGNVHAAVADFLSKALTLLTAHRPTIIFIDDAQWGDLESGQLLHALFRAVPPSVLFILSYTTEDFATSLLLQTFRPEHSDARTTLHLHPLREEEAREMVLSAFGRQRIAEDLLSSILREADGNAFFLEELVSFVREREMTGGAVSLVTVLDERFAALSERARTLIGLVAAAGAPVNADWVRETLNIDRLGDDEFSSVRQQRWIRSRFTGDLEEVEIYHSRLREFVLSRRGELGVRQPSWLRAPQ